MKKEKALLKLLAGNYVNALAQISDSYKKEASPVPSDQDTEAVFFQQYQKIKRTTFLKRKIVPLIAAAILIVTLVSCWKPITKFIVHVYEQFADIFVPEGGAVQDSSDIMLTVEGKEVEITYVPDGFSLNSEPIIMETMQFYDYINPDTGAILSISIDIADGVEKGVDVENAEYKQNPTSFVSEKNGYVILAARKNSYIIEVVGKITKEEADKIIEGVK